MTYTTLIRGDIRQKGDEVKPINGSHYNDPMTRHLIASWQPISPGLLGIEIDFHHVKTAEYRRPNK